MTKGILVREAKSEELSEAATLFSRILMELPYYNALAKDNESKKYSTTRLSEKQSNDKYSVLVAKDDSGKIVGFCFNHFDDFTIWLDWFGVDPAERRKGIGTDILEAVFETARKRGAHKVWCDSRSNNEPSKSLLRKVGFREIAEIKNHWYKQDFILWERLV